MSKKILSLIGVVAVLLSAYTATAWYCGKSYEDQDQQGVTAIHQMLNDSLKSSNLPSDQFKLTRIEFTRGIFSSSGRYQLSQAGSGKIIPVTVRVQHGPFIGVRPARYRAVYEPENVPETNMLFKLTEGKSPLTLTVLERFTKTVSIKVQMPPVTFAEDGKNLVFSGLILNMDSDRDFSFFKGDFTMDNLSTQEPGKKIEVVKLRGDFDMVNNGTYFVGKSKADIESFAYGGVMPVLLNKIKISSDSKDEDQLNHSDTAIEIAGIKVGAQDFGQITWNMSLGRLDMAAYLKVIEAVQRHNSSAVSTHAQTLLAAKPVLNVSPFEWKTAAGKSTVTLKLAFKAAENGQDASKADWLLQWIEKGEMKADLSKAMMNDVGSKNIQLSGTDAATATAQARTMLDESMRPLVERGIFKEGHDAYTADIRFENGMFDINGKRMTPEELSRLEQNPPAASQDGQSASEPSLTP